MSKLQEILIKAKEGLKPWEKIRESEWLSIAEQCSEPEIEELQNRIKELKKELEGVEEWDGDTQDDICQTIYLFERLIGLSKNND